MGQVGLPIQFKKMYGGPINPDSVFNSIEDAQAYASGPLGAPGELLGVKESDESNNYIAYIINGDKTISPISMDVSEILDSLTWKEM